MIIISSHLSKQILHFLKPLALIWKLCHCTVPRILTGCAQEACRKFVQEGGSKEDTVRLAVGNSAAVRLHSLFFHEVLFRTVLKLLKKLTYWRLN